MDEMSYEIRRAEILADLHIRSGLDGIAELAAVEAGAFYAAARLMARACPRRLAHAGLAGAIEKLNWVAEIMEAMFAAHDPWAAYREAARAILRQAKEDDLAGLHRRLFDLALVWIMAVERQAGGGSLFETAAAALEAAEILKGLLHDTEG
ncbi:MAG: hypothetical protein QXV20_06735 [Candidatus Hadarchaeales archaeon]